LQCIFGIGFISTICVVLFKNFEKLTQKPIYLALSVYFIILIGATSLSRGYWGIHTGNIDRYQYVSALLVGAFFLIVVFLYENWVYKNKNIIILLSVLFFTARMGHNIPQMLSHKENLKIQLLKYHLDSGGKLKKGLMSSLIERGIYKSPINQLFKNQNNFELIELPEEGYEAIANINLVQNLNWLKISGFGVIKDVSGLSNKKYLLLKNTNDEKIYKLKVENKPYPKLGKIEPFRSMEGNKPKMYQVKKAGYDINLNKEKIDLPSGKYQFGLLVSERDKYVGVEFFNQFIEL